MNPFNIFTNKNDLVKVLAIGGLFVVLFSLIYPIEKSKELDLKQVELKSEVRTLKRKNKEGKSILKNLETLKKENAITKEELKEIRNNIVEGKERVLNLNDEIKVIKEYTSQYNFYAKLFFWTGFVSSVLGVFFWSVSGISEHNNKKKA